VAADALELPPPASLLVARRQALARSIGAGVVLLAAGEPGPDPQNSGYRGDSNLFYLTGLDVPGSWLLLIVQDGQPDSTLLFLPTTATSDLAPVNVPEVTGASRVHCLSELSMAVRRQIPGSGLPLHLYPGNGATEDTLVQSVQALPGVETRDLSQSLADLRLVKDSAEIARLSRAAEITAQSLVQAVSSIRPGGSEGDVAAAIQSGFVARSASGASFPSIVAAGVNTLILPYNANPAPLDENELVLMDVGAEYGRYAGDVTRTFPISGRFSERQRALYQLVLGTQETALAAVRPGVTLAQLEQLARAYLAAHSGSLCGEFTCDQYFNHLLSHWLGLNVHDAGSRSAVLAPGMVITIEPGIYLPADGLGIRIEDDVLVTATGGTVLSAAAPKTVSEIEALFPAAPGTPVGTYRTESIKKKAPR